MDLYGISNTIYQPASWEFEHIPQLEIVRSDEKILFSRICDSFSWRVCHP